MTSSKADDVARNLRDSNAAVEPASNWSLVFDGFDPAKEGVREALCTLGNGYFATRAAATWAVADGMHYPGTYLAGGYNRLNTDIAGRSVENEDLVNFPNWLALSFRIGDASWFSLESVQILSYRQELDLRCGLLLRAIHFEDKQGRRSWLREQRLVSMYDMHLGALELKLTAENWSGSVTVRSTIDGRVVNAGAKLYRKYNGQHLQPQAADQVGEDAVCLLVRTSQSHVDVAQVARTQMFLDGQVIEVQRRLFKEPGHISQEMNIDLKQGQTLQMEKLVAIYSSRDNAISECMTAAKKAIARAARFDGLKTDHLLAWENLWNRFDVRIQPSGPAFAPNLSMLLRLNMFHLLQTASLHSIGLDTGIPARGWTGEAYQGHVFWDELFIFPFFNYRLPEITRALLIYRYRRLDEARAAAKTAGYKGANVSLAERQRWAGGD